MDIQSFEPTPKLNRGPTLAPTDAGSSCTTAAPEGPRISARRLRRQRTEYDLGHETPLDVCGRSVHSVGLCQRQ